MRSRPDRGLVEALGSRTGGSVNVETMNLKELQSTGMSEILQVLPTPEGGKEEGGGWIDQQEIG